MVFVQFYLQDRTLAWPNDPAQPPLPEGKLNKGTTIVITTALSKRHTGKGRLQQIVRFSSFLNIMNTLYYNLSTGSSWISSCDSRSIFCLHQNTIFMVQIVPPQLLLGYQEQRIPQSRQSHKKSA